jgi:hypothetical protein
MSKMKRYGPVVLYLINDAEFLKKMNILAIGSGLFGSQTLNHQSLIASSLLMEQRGASKSTNITANNTHTDRKKTKGSDIQ